MKERIYIGLADIAIFFQIKPRVESRARIPPQHQSKTNKMLKRRQSDESAVAIYADIPRFVEQARLRDFLGKPFLVPRHFTL